MRKQNISKILLLIVLVFYCLASLTVSAEELSGNMDIPEPIKVVDFSNSFAELAEEDADFEVEENEAKPQLVYDREMGQVLKLGKAVIKNQEFHDKAAYLISDESEYSTIHISNPYAGIDHLVEYAPYEDVKTTLYDYSEQPLWQEGITISYWIKSPVTESGCGLNSNVLGFYSERFQIQADDYANYLCTVRFDLDYSKYTEEEKVELGISLSGVDKESYFYYELAEEKTYDGKPLYNAATLGKLYWMNKNFVNGYVKLEDGTIKTCEEYGFFNPEKTYNYYVEYPTLGINKEEHNPNTSNLRYAWTYSEMWLDASSSFYFENDNEYTNEQLNPNHETSYGTIMGMQHNNCFSANSWKGYSFVEDAEKAGFAADSPVTQPDEWHYVTVIIQNDWVSYYIDGKKIDVKNEYSSYGTRGFVETSDSIWKRFNKGTGSRYGYGTRYNIEGVYSGRYTSPTIMEWITLDCVELTIGGGNRNGDAYIMYADTDEIYIKNVVFYDVMLTDEQIQYLAEKPDIYGEIEISIRGDVNADGNVTAEDALTVLKHAAKLELIPEEETEISDLTGEGTINAEDALEILKIAAKIE